MYPFEQHHFPASRPKASSGHKPLRTHTGARAGTSVNWLRMFSAHKASTCEQFARTAMIECVLAADESFMFKFVFIAQFLDGA